MEVKFIPAIIELNPAMVELISVIVHLIHTITHWLSHEEDGASLSNNKLISEIIESTSKIIELDFAVIGFVKFEALD